MSQAQPLPGRKLLVVTSTFPRWKNDSDPPFVYELSCRLAERYIVTVHTPHYPGAETKERLDGMQIHRFRYFFSPMEKLAGSIGILPTLEQNKWYYGVVPFFLLAQFVSLLLLVRKIRPDVIHAHWVIPQGFIAVLVKMITGVPVVVTAHGTDVFGLQGILFKTIKRFTLQRVQSIVAVSSAIANVLTEFLSLTSKPVVIPMGVDSEIFHPNKRDHKVRTKYAVKDYLLLYVGRLTEKKGVQYLIDAMLPVLRDIPNVKLLIVGGGEFDDKLRAQVLRLGLGEHVYFAGRCPNAKLPAYYASADIFISPSITEGFGLTFVEAAMSGCLLIGTDTGGIQDIIKDGETGFLVSEKSSAALADAILYAIHHKLEINTLKAKSRAVCIENFDWKLIARKYSNILNRFRR
ncbi:Glycosyltransferase [Candidatus Electrothrix gigas]